MTEARVVPAILVCSGHKKDGRYKKPNVNIISPPDKQIKVKIGWDDDVKISVPIIYRESSVKQDVPKYRVTITNDTEADGSYGFHKSKAYKGEDKKGKFDKFKKALRIEIPPPTPDIPDSEVIPDQIILPTDTFQCNLYAELQIKDWQSSGLEKPVQSIIKEDTVWVTIERERNFINECPHCHQDLHEVAVLGLPDQSEFYAAKRFVQVQEERKMWEEKYQVHLAEMMGYSTIEDIPTPTELFAEFLSRITGEDKEDIEEVLAWIDFAMDIVSLGML